LQRADEPPLRLVCISTKVFGSVYRIAFVWDIRIAKDVDMITVMGRHDDVTVQEAVGIVLCVYIRVYGDKARLNTVVGSDGR
jgi:hypothetical protein